MTVPVSRFPALKARKALLILARVGYQQERRRGSHCVLTAPGRLPIIFAFHEGSEVPPAALRHMLANRAQLTDEEIEALL